MKKIFILIFYLLSSVYITHAQIGIHTTNPQGVFHIDSKKNNPNGILPTAEQQHDDFVILADGTIGIGTSTPHSSAMIELNTEHRDIGSKKGFLAPKVALTSYTDNSTITNPAEGLLVYNLGTNTNFTYKGYVFWNGSEWRTFSGGSLAPGTVGAFVCNSITLTPSSYTTGTPYNGTLSIPYINGNGGIYEAQTIGPVNGLTATLTAGSLEVGPGTLYYAVTGTPTVTSPETTTFTITLGATTCTAIVGIGDDVKAGELVYYKANNIDASIGSGGNDGTITANWLSSNVDVNSPLPVIGGKLRVDGYFSDDANSTGSRVSFNPRLVNVASTPTKFWFAALTNVDRRNGSNIVLSAAGSNSGAPGGGGWVNLDNGIYSNLAQNQTLANPSNSITDTGSNNQEVVTLDIDLDNKWYRVYYFINVDNNNTNANTSDGDNFRRLYISIQRLY